MNGNINPLRPAPIIAFLNRFKNVLSYKFHLFFFFFCLWTQNCLQRAKEKKWRKKPQLIDPNFMRKNVNNVKQFSPKKKKQKKKENWYPNSCSLSRLRRPLRFSFLCRMMEKKKFQWTLTFRQDYLLPFKLYISPLTLSLSLSYLLL